MPVGVKRVVIVFGWSVFSRSSFTSRVPVGHLSGVAMGPNVRSAIRFGVAGLCGFGNLDRGFFL